MSNKLTKRAALKESMELWIYMYEHVEVYKYFALQQLGLTHHCACCTYAINTNLQPLCKGCPVWSATTSCVARGYDIATTLTETFSYEIKKEARAKLLSDILKAVRKYNNHTRNKIEIPEKYKKFVCN